MYGLVSLSWAILDWWCVTSASQLIEKMSFDEHYGIVEWRTVFQAYGYTPTGEYTEVLYCCWLRITEVLIFW